MLLKNLTFDTVSSLVAAVATVVDPVAHHAARQAVRCVDAAVVLVLRVQPRLTVRHVLENPGTDLAPWNNTFEVGFGSFSNEILLKI